MSSDSVNADSMNCQCSLDRKEWLDATDTRYASCGAESALRWRVDYTDDRPTT